MTAQSPQLAAFAARLPDPEELERRFRVLGIIEAMFTDHDFRYAYSRTFLQEPQRVGRYDNGAGDVIYAFFGDDGAFVRAFDHQDPLSPIANGEIWPGLLDGLPEPFARFVDIPELEDEDEEDGPSITLAVWSTGGPWQHGAPQPDESGEEPEPTTWMFKLLAGEFSAALIAEDYGRYFEADIESASLMPFLELQPLTRERVLAVNPAPEWDFLHQLAVRAGYPSELDA